MFIVFTPSQVSYRNSQWLDTSTYLFMPRRTPHKPNSIDTIKFEYEWNELKENKKTSQSFKMIRNRLKC